MFGVDLKALLDSLDTVAKETLEDPKESATRIRSKRKQAAFQSAKNVTDNVVSGENSVKKENDEPSPSPGNNLLEESVHSPTSAIPTGLPLDEGSTHSNRTQESYVLPNGSVTGSSIHGSSEDAPRDTSLPASALPSNSSTDAIPALSSTFAAASKLIVPNISGSLSRKSANSASAAALSGGDTAAGFGNDSDLRKQLKLKTKEIETLNQECLDLEEQTTSLKQEVQEAWDHYKLSQEKAAAREAELQDEINILQKAKQLDKQQSVGQITKLNEDIELILQQLQQLRDEKQVLTTQLSEQESIHNSYQERIHAMEEELKEARMNSLQGAHHLREEVKQLQIQREQMTTEHNRLLKQLHARQSQLEQENAQLNVAMANHQQEMIRWKQQGNAQQNNGNNTQSVTAGVSGVVGMNEDYMNREILALRQELSTLQQQYNTQGDAKQTIEIQLRQVERDYRVLQLTHDEYRQRASDTEMKLQQSIQSLEAQVQQFQMQHQQQQTQPSSLLARGSMSVDANEDLPSSQYRGISLNNNSNANNITASGMVDLHSYRELKQQVEHLSKMLLRKQSDLIDVTAERTTLKSKILDLQTKCSSLETQLAQLRDLEDGDQDEDYYHEDYAGDSVGIRNSNSSGFLRSGEERLMQRRVGRSSGGGSSSSSSGKGNISQSNAKVISDLEKFGVKPNASVTKAVTMIDTMALCTGKFLRSNPLIRLFFVLYLVLLHVWVLVILVVHTHALEMPADPRSRVTNNVFKAPLAASMKIAAATIPNNVT